jgi:hypothetical protein
MMEKLYINLSDPLANRKTNKKTQKIFGFVLIVITLVGIIIGIIRNEFGFYFFWMLTYLVWGILWAFQDKNSFYGNNFVSLDDEKLEFKLGLTMKRKKILWKEVQKVTINITSIQIDYIDGSESIKTDWVLYKDVKELKSSIRNICSENKIILSEN